MQGVLSTHKNQLCFYKPAQFKKKIKETIPFIITSKRIQYPGINLTKKVKNLYTETITPNMTVFGDTTFRRKSRLNEDRSMMA